MADNSLLQPTEIIDIPFYGFKWWTVDGFRFLFDEPADELYEICPPGKVMIFRCSEEAEEHSVPMVNCTCGIFAFRNAVDVPIARFENRVVAVGVVALWGRVIEEEYGFRAQFAYPVRLLLIGKGASKNRAARLSESYGVPVRALDTKIVHSEEIQQKVIEFLGGRKFPRIFLSMPREIPLLPPEVLKQSRLYEKRRIEHDVGLR